MSSRPGRTLPRLWTALRGGRSSARARTPRPLALDYLEDRALLSADPLQGTVAVSNPTAYVTQLYADLLGRAPDSNGLNSFVSALDSGQIGPDQLVQSFLHSTEYETDVTRGLYQGLTGSVTQDQINSGVAFLAGGGTTAELAAQVFGSQSYFDARANGTNQGYVTALYQDILFRAPDSSAQGFVNQINNGTSREEIARQILSSEEGETNQVRGLYFQLLHRAPDAGSQGFVDELQSGTTNEEVIGQIATSGEYLGRFGGFLFHRGGPNDPNNNGGNVSPQTAAANQAYVTRLYEVLLQRAPDSAGLASFTDQLNQGTSQQDVVQQFLDSTEFQQVEVSNLYTQLGVTSTSSQITSGANFLAGGGTVQQLASQILTTDSFFNQQGGGTNQGYVDALYQTVLLRTGSAAETQSYVNQLNAGASRASVVNTILGSNEATTLVVQSLYLRLLGRLPDAAGSQGFVSDLENGTSLNEVITQIATSTEFNDLATANLG